MRGVFQTVWPLVTMSPLDTKCSKKLEYCPKGHQMDACKLSETENGRFCKQCGDNTFQPNQNKYGDQCRLRRNCGKRWMKWKDDGNKTTDAVCECQLGYHFESDDQRACVPNKECEKGFGQGAFGICENCFEKHMWSDTVANKNESCKPLKSCEKESRCTITKSNGTFDTKCGPVVTDISQCDHLAYESSTATNSTNTGLFIWIALGVIGALIILVIIIVYCIVTRRCRKVVMQRQLKSEQLEELLPEIIKRSRKDEVYCKKVLDALQKEVEDRINNQIWALPRELFQEPASFEILVEKYKDTQQKFAINGYMQDWRSLRGNTGEAVNEMIKCLRCENVKRSDIVLEIVNNVSNDLFEVCDGSGGHSKRSSKSSKRFCPCSCEDEIEVYECKETCAKLLSTSTANEKGNNSEKPPDETHDAPGHGGVQTPIEAGNIYRQRTTPSAPISYSGEMYPQEDLKGTHFYDRSESVPIQASS